MLPSTLTFTCFEKLLASDRILPPNSALSLQCPPLEEKQTCKASKCSKRNRDRVSAFRGMYKYLELDSYLSLVPIDILTLLTLVYK